MSGVLIHDSADKTPPPTPGRHPLTPISGADWHPRGGVRLPPQAWLILTVLCVGIVAWLLWRLDTALRDFLSRYWWLGEGLLLTVTLVLTGAIVAALVGGVQWGRVQLAQRRVVRTRHGALADVITVIGVTQEQAEAPQIALETNAAPYRLHPTLSTLSVPKAEAAPSAPKALTVSEDAPAIDLVPESAWLPWLDEAPHLLIAGSTGSGKTTLAHVALSTLSTGASGVVIDPKGKPWGGLPVHGGGRNFAAALDALDGIRSELEARYTAYADGERSFAPLIVIVDEVPDIVQHCAGLSRSDRDPRWALFARSLGSLAREVAIRVILLTQSPNVEDIGLNGGMRGNYTRIALAEKIPLLLNEDVDSARREALRRLYRGLAHPAALLRRGAVHLLDTRRVPTLAEQPIVAGAWHVPVVSSRTRVDVDELLRRAVRAKWTREQARASLRAKKIEFANERWTRAVEAVEGEQG